MGRGVLDGTHTVRQNRGTGRPSTNECEDRLGRGRRSGRLWSGTRGGGRTWAPPTPIPVREGGWGLHRGSRRGEGWRAGAGERVTKADGRCARRSYDFCGKEEGRCLEEIGPDPRAGDPVGAAGVGRVGAGGEWVPAGDRWGDSAVARAGTASVRSARPRSRMSGGFPATG